MLVTQFVAECSVIFNADRGIIRFYTCYAARRRRVYRQSAEVRLQVRSSTVRQYDRVCR